MAIGFDDDYIVYVRFDDASCPDDMELPVASCASYEEAVRVQRSHLRSQRALIRFQGDVGGGD